MAALTEFAVFATIPPTYAKPAAPRSRIFLPKPTGFDGQGKPCGAVGKPYYVFFRRYMTHAGHDYWMDIFDSYTSDGYTIPVTNISIYNSQERAMQEFATGTMHLPEWESENGNLWYENYTFQISELVPV